MLLYIAAVSIQIICLTVVFGVLILFIRVIQDERSIRRTNKETLKEIEEYRNGIS